MSDNVTLRESAAEEIRVLLARRKISGSELARKVGVTQPYMSRRLNGEVAFDLDDLEQIALALDVEVTDLLPRPTPGRLLTTVGARRDAPNAGSGRVAVRPTPKRRTRIARPIGGTHPVPTGPAVAVTPTQRRPMLVSGPGQRMAA